MAVNSLINSRARPDGKQTKNPTGRRNAAAACWIRAGEEKRLRTALYFFRLSSTTQTMTAATRAAPMPAQIHGKLFWETAEPSAEEDGSTDCTEELSADGLVTVNSAA